MKQVQFYVSPKDQDSKATYENLTYQNYKAN